MKKLFVLIMLLSTVSLFSKDILFEAKGVCFLPSNQIFKQTYNHAAPEIGLELTGFVGRNVYGFVSVDFFNKNGQTSIFGDTTNLQMTQFGVGLKYFIDVGEGSSFYFGLGAQPTYYSILNDSPFVEHEQSGWTFGGISKFGLIVDIPHNLFFDFFVAYSFVHTQAFTPFNSNIQFDGANLNGTLLGIGIGYRFH
ncbi:MAG: hypothetical protein ACXWL5_01275 [Candidatus Chromulinivorax sp.]